MMMMMIAVAWDLVLVGMVCYVGLETGRVFAYLLACYIAIVLVVVVFGSVCMCVWDLFWGSVYLAVTLFAFSSWKCMGKGKGKVQFGSVKRRIFL